MSKDFPKFRGGDPFGLLGPNRALILDAGAAKFLEDMAGEMRRLGSIDAIPPIVIEDVLGGRKFEAQLPPRIHAKLTTSSNPYGFVEQVPDPAGGWIDKPGGLTGEAYESNGLAGLTDRVVRIAYQPVSDDWRFQFLRIGRALCPVCIGGVRDTCQPVGTLFPGVTITVTQGGTTVGSCTTINQVASVSISGGGSGYTPANPPAVVFTGGGGSGAAGNVVIQPGVVSSITKTNSGSGYTSAPTVALTGGGGTGAAATAVMSGGAVTSLTLGSAGSGYASLPTLTLTGGGGSGATGSVDMGVELATVVNPGSGYTNGTYALGISGDGFGATGTFTVSGGVVSSITITAPGSQFSAPPTLTFPGAGGTGATGSAKLNAVSLHLGPGGSGYTTAPTVTITGGGGSGITGTAAVATMTVSSITVTHGGTNYTSAPTVSFTGGGGTGAAATATRTGSTIIGVVLSSGGSGYTSAPAVSFVGGVGSGATAVAVVKSQCCFGDLEPGTYTVTATKAGYTSDTDTFTVLPNCTGTTIPILSLALTPIDRVVCFAVYGCGIMPGTPGIHKPGWMALGVPSVNISVTGPGGTFPATTDAGGNACVTLTDAGPYTATITDPSGCGYGPASVTGITGNPCGPTSYTVQLPLATGYICGCDNTPWPETIPIADNNGTWDLVYSGTDAAYQCIWNAFGCSGIVTNKAGCAAPTDPVGPVTGSVNYCYSMTCIRDSDGYFDYLHISMGCRLIIEGPPPPTPCQQLLWEYIDDHCMVVKSNPCSSGGDFGADFHGFVAAADVGTCPFDATGSLTPTMYAYNVACGPPPSPTSGTVTLG